MILPSTASTWPTVAILEQFGLTTPLLALNLDQLGHLLRITLDEYQQQGISWQPILPPPALMLISPVLRAANLEGCSSFSLVPIPRVPEKRPRINLLRPPIVAAGPARLANALNDWEISVCCDHFAQAERLANALNQADRTISSDLRVDVGPNRWGVSPGSELRDLARGVSRLSRITLRGLCLPPRLGGIAGNALRFHDSEFVRLAIASVRSLTEIGHNPTLLLVDSLETALLLADHLPDTSLASLAPPAGDFIRVMAGVIARPLREVAILDAGLTELGTAPSLAPNATWRVDAVERAFTRLVSDTGGNDLAIGEIVSLSPSRDAPLPQAAPRLLLHKGKWKTAGDL